MAEGNGVVQSGEKEILGDLNALYNCLMGDCGEVEVGLVVVLLSVSHSIPSCKALGVKKLTFAVSGSFVLRGGEEGL